MELHLFRRKSSSAKVIRDPFGRSSELNRFLRYTLDYSRSHMLGCRFRTEVVGVPDYSTAPGWDQIPPNSM